MSGQPLCASRLDAGLALGRLGLGPLGFLRLGDPFVVANAIDGDVDLLGQRFEFGHLEGGEVAEGPDASFVE